MRMMRFLVVLLSCLGVATAGMAAMPCCQPKADNVIAVETAMPCHMDADAGSSGKMHNTMTSCKCLHTAQAFTLPQVDAPMRVAQSWVMAFMPPAFQLAPIHPIDEPPRLFS